MATYTISPQPGTMFLQNGEIVVGGLVWTYLAGTTTPVDTFTSSSGTAHTNPIILQSDGLAPGGEIYLEPGQSYKFVFETAATPPAHGSVIKTFDNVAAVPASAANQEVLGTAGENLLEGECVYLSDGSGGNNAGQWYKADADAAYSSTLPQLGFAVTAIATGDTGAIRSGGQLTVVGPLTPGASYYVSTIPGAITTGITNNQRPVGQAESATSLILAANPAPFPLPDNTNLILSMRAFV